MTSNTDTLENNPLLQHAGLPLFDAIQPEHVVPAVKHCIAEAEKQLADIEQNANPTWDGVMQPLEELDQPFEQAWGPVGHLLSVQNSPEIREAHETVLQDVVNFGLRVGQSQPIYKALKAIKDGDVWATLSETQKRIVDDKLLNAELAGVGLEGEALERFNQIARDLSKLSTDFSNHVLDATKAWSLTVTAAADVEGWPESLKQLTAQSHNQTKAEDEPAATPESGPWRVTLDGPVVQPFLQHSRNRGQREQVFRAYLTRASSGEWDNTDIITRTLQLRQQKAALLGYQNFAQLSLAKKMAPSVEAVLTLSEELRAASYDNAQQDLEDLKELAAASGQTEELLHWDVAFWAERLREQKFDYTDEELRPYFALPNVLEGMFGLVRRLFGIVVTAADGEAPVWQKDVRYFKIADEDGTQLAAFYLDPYSRPENKRGGAWMDDCLSRRMLDGEVQLPVAHLVCNSTPPVGDKPSLMTFREVETLFHEFGHGLQHMLTTVNEADASGINGVEWDAVELPSQFMENWCYHKPTLIGMTSHVETGEPLPDELFEKICAARNFRAGSMMLRQLSFGITDLELHSNFDPDGTETIFDVQRRVAETTSVLPLLPEDRFLCAFSHIFAGGYAAGYYSYKWAEVLSADAFSAFEDAGLEDEVAVADTGRRFRNTILSQGGSRHPMEVFEDFRGRQPSTEALLRHNGLLG